MSDPVRLRLAHSPDPDDAFMWWPLVGRDDEGPAIDVGRFRFDLVHDDIEALNRRAEGGDLEITALSCARYPAVAGRYALTACGASMGDGYGPKLVARAACDAAALRGARIAVPGRLTSAFGALSLLLGPGAFEPVEAPFDAIEGIVAGGEVDAGVVIHEGQLTYARSGLHLVEDLGAWWMREHGGPMPLGVNAIRRDLEELHGPGTLLEVARLLRRSVEHALAHRDEAIEYALRFARGIDAATADRFVAMYVNRWTLAFGPEGEAAVRRFLAALAGAGLVPAVDPIFVGGGAAGAPT